MSASTENPLGILFVGHGTRNLTGAQDFLRLANRLALAMPDMALEPAFLELQSPDIDTGIARLLARGAKKILVVPLLLFSAGHAKQDVPDAVRAALQKHALPGMPPLPCIQSPHLGCHPQLIELSCVRIREVLQSQADNPSLLSARELATDAAAETCLLMVGRGSRDASATAEMHAYASQVAQQIGCKQLKVAFVAMALPTLPDVFAEVLAGSVRRVIVVPHLLFAGDLLDQVTQAVTNAGEKSPQQLWRQAGILGFDVAEPAGGAQLIVQALEQIARKTIADWPESGEISEK